MELVKLGVEFDLRYVAWARQGNSPVTDNTRRRPRRHDHDPIGQRNRFFQIVCHKKNGLAIGVPQIEE